MDASNKLCVPLLCEYRDFKPMSAEAFTGYKLAEKKNLNYYSIVSGLFRYRAKRVSENSYHGLYMKEGKHFNEHLVDKVAVFTTQEDAYNALHQCGSSSELVMLEIILMGDLHAGYYTNKFVRDVPVVIGHTMDSVKECRI